MSKRYSFPKKQRLTGEISVGKLFTEGKSFIAFPLRFVFLTVEKNEEYVPARIVINVPKKRIKRANGRNLLKRRIREAYRLHKENLLEQLTTKNHTLHIGVNYIGNEQLPYNLLEKKMIEALSRISNQLDEKIEK